MEPYGTLWNHMETHWGHFCGVRPFMAPWLLLMVTVGKAQITWGPQPMFLSAPWHKEWQRWNVDES